MQRDLVDRANFATLQMGCFSPPVFWRRPVFKLASLRYGFLVVNQTIAKTMPCQQTLKIGQMIPCKEETI